MESKHVKNDMSASILIRAIHLLEAYLGTTVHVRHRPRVSTEEAVLVDNLSRNSTTTAEDLKLVGLVEEKVVTGELCEWLVNPTLNWNLPYRLLAEVKAKMGNLQ